MKKLNEKALKVGDIILTTSTAAVSKAIRLWTWSDISHAMIYVEDHSVIDATGDGVHSRNTQRLFFEDHSAVHVLRLKEDLTVAKILEVCTFIRAQVGTQYSVREAIQSAAGGSRQWTRKQYCSRLVAQAFASIGIFLATDPNYCSPNDLKGSALLEAVQDATIQVSSIEVARWERLEDTTQEMRDVTNRLLDGARTKNPAIQSLNDINDHVIQHPEDDDFLAKLLHSSGYLTIWETERNKNLWQYELPLMEDRARSSGGMEEYCWTVLAGELGGPNRYIVNRGAYTLLSRQYKRGYLLTLAELYDLLSTLHRARVRVASVWLQRHGLLGAVPETVLIPHTPEWFAALEIWDPPQAMMTRTAIATFGRDDICSICGDDPAADYRVSAGHRPSGGVDTLRLCDDCLKIKTDRGEPFEPLPTE